MVVAARFVRLLKAGTVSLGGMLLIGDEVAEADPNDEAMKRTLTEALTETLQRRARNRRR
jgi:hypothetical protein